MAVADKANVKFNICDASGRVTVTCAITQVAPPKADTHNLYDDTFTSYGPNDKQNGSATNNCERYR